MEKSDSNLSTPSEPPKPKKKRGRPPGSNKKTRLSKKQKVSSSPVPTSKGPRHHWSRLPGVPPQPITLHTRLLGSLNDTFGKLVDVLESMSENGNADKVYGYTQIPNYFGTARQSGRAEQRPQSLQIHSPRIGSTSSNEDAFPQQSLDEVGEPGSVDSAKRASSEEVKKTVQLFERLVRELMSTPAIPAGEKEKESDTGVEEGREAVEKDHPKSIYLRAALQALDEAGVASLRGKGVNVSPQEKVVDKDVLTVPGRFATPKHRGSRDT